MTQGAYNGRCGRKREVSLSAALDDTRCLQWALWKEARGEPLKALRGVYDVVHNRMAATGQSACKVLHTRGQFPYFKRGVKKVDFAFTVKYNVVVGMMPVLSKDYLYFNHYRHPWGKQTVKIGNLYFSK